MAASMRLLDLLNTGLPEVKYRTSATAGASWEPISYGKHPPDGYHPWQDFGQQVVEHLQRSKDSEDACFNYPPVYPGDILNEEGVRWLLYVYWTRPIKQMGLELVRRGISAASPNFGWSDSVGDVIGCPDLVIFEGSFCKAIVEAKSRDMLDPSYPASQLCAGVGKDERITSALSQIYAYISLNLIYGVGSGYGIITNFESTWFCKVSQGSMLISDPIKATDCRPGLYASLWYFLHLIYRDPTTCRAETQPTEALTPVLQDVVTRSCLSSRTPPETTLPGLQALNHGDVKFDVCIASSGHSIVYRGTFGGTPAVIKALDMTQKPHLLDGYVMEVHAYHLLEQLQGKCIPRLLGYGFLHHGTIFLLALSDAGESLHSLVSKQELHADDKTLCAEVQSQAIRKLKSIHSLGLVHGDVGIGNICFKHEDGKLEVKWVDLEGCKMTDNVAGKAELKQLESVFPQAFASRA